MASALSEPLELWKSCTACGFAKEIAEFKVNSSVCKGCVAQKSRNTRARGREARLREELIELLHSLSEGHAQTASLEMLVQGTIASFGGVQAVCQTYADVLKSAAQEALKTGKCKTALDGFRGLLNATGAVEQSKKSLLGANLSEEDADAIIREVMLSAAAQDDAAIIAIAEARGFQVIRPDQPEKVAHAG